MPKRAAYPAPASSLSNLFAVKPIAEVSDIPDGLTTHIPTSSVFISPLQYRCYVDPTEVEDLAQSIQSQGLLEPIIVRTVGDRHELAIGQKRLLAHQHLKMQTIEAKVLPLTDADLVEISLIENNMRSQPNAWEETCGILKLLELKLEMDRSEVISLFNQAANQKRGSTNNAVRSDQWQTLEDVLKSVSALTPDSFRAHRLPILNLPDDVQSALRHGKLEYTKARAIARIEDADNRSLLLDSVIEENLSLRDIQERVQSFKRIQSASEDARPTDPMRERQQNLKQLVAKVKGLPPDKQKKFDRLLQQMMELAQ